MGERSAPLSTDLTERQTPHLPPRAPGPTTCDLRDAEYAAPKRRVHGVAEYLPHLPVLRDLELRSGNEREEGGRGLRLRGQAHARNEESGGDPNQAEEGLLRGHPLQIRRRVPWRRLPERPRDLESRGRQGPEAEETERRRRGGVRWRHLLPSAALDRPVRPARQSEGHLRRLQGHSAPYEALVVQPSGRDGPLELAQGRPPRRPGVVPPLPLLRRVHHDHHLKTQVVTACCSS